jgi:hypothetical protein
MHDRYPRWTLETLVSELARLKENRAIALDHPAEIERMEQSIRAKERVSEAIKALLGNHL